MITVTDSTLPTRLSVSLKLEPDGPAIATESVEPADLGSVLGEAWRDGCLRKGHPSLALSDVLMELIPVFGENAGPVCSGFSVTVPLPDGQSSAIDFGIHSLSHVAPGIASRLQSSGTLKPGQQYYFEVLADSAVERSRMAELPAPFSMSMTVPPLRWLDIPFKALREGAEPVSAVDGGEFPVFMTAEALERAEECSRRGGEAQPPVETGGVLVGSLAACPATGEFYCVVTDVLEVEEAEQSTFSLTYTSASWTRIQKIVQAKQSAHPGRAERILGQCHGHNFVPNDGKTCEACLKLPVCNLTSVFVSQPDESFTRAVFVRQPWALCHIFGLTARKDRVNKLFSIKEGVLRSRGYFVLPEFDADDWAPSSAIARGGAVE